MEYHNPVLLQSACDLLDIKKDAKYIDATYGGGGHTREIEARGGKVLSIDQDADAQAQVHANFVHLQEVAAEHNWQPVSGILFDLGVSSHQIDIPEKGFSFQKEGPLDMRMGESAITAEIIVNQFPIAQLSQLLFDFGEIPQAKSLAAKIIENRPILTTTELARLTGPWTRQAFQALRIAVNDELGALQTVLPQALDVLETGGRLVVITFHSLEDRVVKDQFKEWENQKLVTVLTPKPLVPSPEEQSINSRSKSAKLRAIAKL